MRLAKGLITGNATREDATLNREWALATWRPKSVASEETRVVKGFKKG